MDLVKQQRIITASQKTYRLTRTTLKYLDKYRFTFDDGSVDFCVILENDTWAGRL